MKAMIAAVLFIWVGPALAAEFKKKDLIGVWTYVTAFTVFADGRVEPQFSDEPQGVFIIAANGSYAHIIMSKDLPRVASQRFKTMTTEEAEKIAEGVLAHYGTWEANEKAGTFKVKIKKSSFPNFDGVTQVRTLLTLTKDTLSYRNDLAVTAPGAQAVATLRRVR